MADSIVKKTVRSFRKMKQDGEKIVMITAYDAPTAAFAEAAGIDFILVGDSLSMNTLGYADTIPATMDVMVHHAQCVRRGAPNTFIVGDMPFMTCHLGVENTLREAARFMQEAGCDAVKLECTPSTLPSVRALVEAGIPVQGHIGLLPQSVKTSGGYRVRGRGEEEAAELVARAKALEEAGVFSMVLECVPSALAAKITASVGVPTIGIGAGPDCDGQVQVISDLLGYTEGFLPKHARRFCHVGSMAQEAIAAYIAEVKEKTFPGPENSF